MNASLPDFLRCVMPHLRAMLLVAAITLGDGVAWALWRPYSCCKREGQVFLGSVDFD